MLISTKGRYALRVMLDLAQQEGSRLIPLNEIALRQDISEKYLESIIVVLSRAGLVRAVRGKGGGYRLNRPASEYTVANIVKLTDGSLAPVACMEEDAHHCARAAQCLTRPLWTELNALINNYLESATLQDLLDGRLPRAEVLRGEEDEGGR